MDRIIFKCINNHYYINATVCPYCNQKYVKKFDFIEGDCISCGQLCSENAYCCNSPMPLSQDVFLQDDKE